MGNSTSTPANAAAISGSGADAEKKTPSCKICCACPAERRARDECTLLKNMEDCEKEMAAFYQCLLTEGFSQEEVNKLRKNTKQM